MNLLNKAISGNNGENNEMNFGEPGSGSGKRGDHERKMTDNRSGPLFEITGKVKGRSEHFNTELDKGSNSLRQRKYPTLQQHPVPRVVLPTLGTELKLAKHAFLQPPPLPYLIKCLSLYHVLSPTSVAPFSATIMH